MVNEGELYKLAILHEVLYKDSKGGVFKGSYKSSKQQVVYPDFYADSINDWFISLKTFLENKITKNIDGFILTDNWPSQTSFRMVDNQQFPYLTNVSLQIFFYFKNKFSDFVCVC